MDNKNKETFRMLAIGIVVIFSFVGMELYEPIFQRVWTNKWLFGGLLAGGFTWVIYNNFSKLGDTKCIHKASDKETNARPNEVNGKEAKWYLFTVYCFIGIGLFKLFDVLHIGLGLGSVASLIYFSVGILLFTTLKRPINGRSGPDGITPVAARPSITIEGLANDNDIAVVIKRAAHLEHIIEDKFSAELNELCRESGKNTASLGLGEKVKLLEAQMANEIKRDLWAIIHVRNKIAHDATIGNDNVSEFVERCDRIIKALGYSFP
jgi:hypothetical protein